MNIVGEIQYGGTNILLKLGMSEAAAIIELALLLNNIIIESVGINWQG